MLLLSDDLIRFIDQARTEIVLKTIWSDRESSVITRKLFLKYYGREECSSSLKHAKFHNIES